jgi:hypothetical protein
MLVFGASAHAAEYKFCVACDNYRAATIVTSNRSDLSKDWFKLKTALMYQNAHHSEFCRVGEYDLSECGGDPQERLDYTRISNDQITALLSDKPITVSQAAYEIMTDFPAATVDTLKRGWNDTAEFFKRLFKN